MPSTVTLMLVYESASGGGGIPIVRISDPALAKAVGRTAVQNAMRRARMAYAHDPRIGREEYIAASRLSEILSVLIPAA